MKSARKICTKRRLLFTALDEVIPSSARIQMAETVGLPKIQTMPGYTRRHYEEETLAALMRMIRCGDLGVQCGGKLLWETTHTGPGDEADLSKAASVISANSRPVHAFPKKVLCKTTSLGW